MGLLTPRLALTLGAMCLVLLGFVPQARAEGGWAKVTYVDGGERVYLDGGEAAGLRGGMSVSVERQGAPVGLVEIISVSKGRAAARILDVSRAIKAGDAIRFEAAPAEVRAEPARALPEVLPLGGDARRQAWHDALLAQPRPLIAYEGGPAQAPSRLRVRAETEISSRAYFGASHLQRNEQRVSLWTQGKSVGVDGLDLKIRGDVALRYGGGPYRYQTGQVAVLQLREAALRYAIPAEVNVAAGRFKPDARVAGLVDGAQLRFDRRGMSLSAFGGLRPSLTNLSFRPDVPTFGVAAGYTSPGDAPRDWRVGVGYVVEGGQGAVHSIAVDSAVFSGERWLRQQATIRLGAEGAGVGLLSIQGRTGVGEDLTLDAAARYIDPVLSAADTTTQTSTWGSFLGAQAIARADVGLSIPRSELKTLRPFVYWHHQAIAGGDDVFVAAAGLNLRREKILGSGVTVDVRGDYGDGTRQQARLGLTASARPGDGFTTAFGLSQQWTFTHASDLHTFQHLLHSFVTYGGSAPVDLWLGAQGGIDHSPYVQKALGGWLSGQLGLSGEW